MEPTRHLSQRLQEQPHPQATGSENGEPVNIVLSEGDGSAVTAKGAVAPNPESKKLNRYQSANAAGASPNQQQRSMPLKTHSFASNRKGPSVSALVSEQRRQLQKTHVLQATQLGKRRNRSVGKVPASRFANKTMLTNI